MQKSTKIPAKGPVASLQYMKRLNLALLAVHTMLALHAQKNNPYDVFGANYFSSIDIIASDISKSGFRGVDQSSLDFYNSLSLVKAKINPEVANAVYQAQIKKGLKIGDVIDQSKFSANTKNFLLKIHRNLDTYSPDEKREYFEQLTGAVLKSDIITSEKDLTLKLISVANVAHQNNRVYRQPRGCYIEGPDDSGQASATTCVILAATAGAIMGTEICGVWCGVGGAIVFGVLTAIAVC